MTFIIKITTKLINKDEEKLLHGISVILSSSVALCDDELQQIQGKGIGDGELADGNEPVAGCACCLCSPEVSASGGKKYASSYH